LFVYVATQTSWDGRGLATESELSSHLSINEMNLFPYATFPQMQLVIPYLPPHNLCCTKATT